MYSQPGFEGLLGFDLKKRQFGKTFNIERADLLIVNKMTRCPEQRFESVPFIFMSQPCKSCLERICLSPTRRRCVFFESQKVWFYSLIGYVKKTLLSKIRSTTGGEV